MSATSWSGNIWYCITLMKNIAKHQNATCDFQALKRGENIMNTVAKLLTRHHFDLTIDTIIEIPELYSQAFESINIFETDGYCALVPFAPRKSFWHAPFDLWTWILIFFTVCCCAIVWYWVNKDIQTKSSVGYFVFSFIAHFIGQSVPFQNLRVRQELLLLPSILISLVLGKTYQSLIISFIFDAKFRAQLTTINEMVNQNFFYHVDGSFQEAFNESYDYTDFKS